MVASEEGLFVKCTCGAVLEPVSISNPITGTTRVYAARVPCPECESKQKSPERALGEGKPVKAREAEAEKWRWLYD